jgi:hypothetical protein
MRDDFAVRVPNELKPDLAAYAADQAAAAPGAKWTTAAGVRALLVDGLARWKKRAARRGGDHAAS